MKKWIVTCVAVALTAALGVLLWRLDIPHWQKLDLSRLRRADTAAVVYDADGHALGALDGGRRAEWIALSDVPEAVQSAFIAAEDLRFYRHHGVDVYRMFGAFWQDLRTLSYAQGASTITQQLVKLTHLTQAKTLSRKIQEILLALQLERKLDKKEILEAYLNAVYFGHGAYGIESAAQVYFGKSASELSLSEGALLAGVIKAPSSYAPHIDPEKAVERRNAILHVMAKNGFIDESERSRAADEGVQLTASAQDGPQYAWALDAVLSEAQSLLGWSAEEILTSGIRIHTGLNVAMQTAAEDLFADSERFPGNAGDGTPVQGAFIAMDAGSGEVCAIVGGRSYSIRRGLNRATQARRQPGSAFKPISTYAAAVDAFGYVPSSIIDDTPRIFADGYTPGNAGGGSNGPVTLREALSRSLNIATVDLAETVGIDAVRDYAQRFGIPLSAQDANLALSLGALTDGVTPMELCGAYCTLANGGIRVNPHLIRSIEGSDGRTLYVVRQPMIRAIGADSAYLLADMLRTAATNGSARALSQSDVFAAGKTGTVSEPSGGTRDVWTAAFTPELAMVAWMGFDHPDAGHALPAGEGGSGYPARLCAAFLSAVGRKGPRGFPRPSGISTVLLDADALREDRAALLSTEKTPASHTVTELFRNGNTPTRFSGNWTAPDAVPDFRNLSGPDQAPILAFTAQNSSAEYVLTCTVQGQSREIAVLRGESGEALQYEDTALDLRQSAIYTLLPRNARLWAEGVLLSGPVPPYVEYVPSGVLNKIMGIGGAEATPMPMTEQSSGVQSLFD